jgi:hypothetical protein
VPIKNLEDLFLLKLIVGRGKVGLRKIVTTQVQGLTVSGSRFKMNKN